MDILEFRKMEIEKSATRMIAFCEARFFDLRKWKMKNGN